MGWASGTGLYEEVIRALQSEGIEAPVRGRIHRRLIQSFEYYDWDTQGECCGIDPEFDAALRVLRPTWGTDEEDD